MWSKKQGKNQSAVDFMSAVEVEAGRAKMTGDKLRCVVVQGLFPHVRQFVVTREGTDANSLTKWLTAADAAAEPDSKDDISSAVKYIQRRLEELRVHAAFPSNNSERSRSRSPRRVQFSARSRSPSASHDVYGRSRSASTERDRRGSEGDKQRVSDHTVSDKNT